MAKKSLAADKRLPTFAVWKARIGEGTPSAACLGAVLCTSIASIARPFCSN